MNGNCRIEFLRDAHVRSSLAGTHHGHGSILPGLHTTPSALFSLSCLSSSDRPQSTRLPCVIPAVRCRDLVTRPLRSTTQTKSASATCPPSLEISDLQSVLAATLVFSEDGLVSASHVASLVWGSSAELELTG